MIQSNKPENKTHKKTRKVENWVCRFHYPLQGFTFSTRQGCIYEPEACEVHWLLCKVSPATFISSRAMIWPGNDVYRLNFPIKVHICSAYLFWDCSARDCNGLVSEYKTSQQLNKLLICLMHHIHILSSCSTPSNNNLAICRMTSGTLQGLIADQCLPSNGSRNKC